jgi:hypothetical protein
MQIYHALLHYLLLINKYVSQIIFEQKMDMHTLQLNKSALSMKRDTII